MFRVPASIALVALLCAACQDDLGLEAATFVCGEGKPCAAGFQCMEGGPAGESICVPADQPPPDAMDGEVIPDASDPDAPEGDVNPDGADGDLGPDAPETDTKPDSDVQADPCEGLDWHGLAVGEECTGTGTCGPGTVICTAQDAATCSSMEPSHPDHGATEEVCNGDDDDCDGYTDEDFDWEGVVAGAACSGPGVCSGGTVVCQGDQAAVCSTLLEGHADYAVSVEECNGYDDDCDGLTDEDLGLIATTCGVGPCTGNVGTATCVAGELEGDTCDAQAGAIPETCNNVDDDCDGFTDEDLGLIATICGSGECAGNSGSANCVGGELEGDTCDPLAGAIPEICNNVDDDCDGSTDESFVYEGLPLGSACDGTDDDGCEDGTVTCDLWDADAGTCKESDDEPVALVVGNGLWAVDMTDLDNPQYLANTPAEPVGGSSFGELVLQGDYAYVADFWFGGLGLAIFDVSSPQDGLFLVGSYLEDPASQFISAIAVDGDLAYAGLHTCDDGWSGAATDAPCVDPVVGEAGLLVLDVGDPTAPQPVGFASYGSSYGPAWPRSIQLVGNHAYVADQTQGLVIIDVSDPTQPTVLSKLDYWDQAYCEANYPDGLSSCLNWGAASDVEVVGTYAYVTVGPNGVMVVNVVDPSNPVLMNWTAVDDDLGTDELFGSAGELQMVDGLAYVTAYEEGFVVMDFSDPLSPETLVLVPVEGTGHTTGMQVIGKTAVVTHTTAGVLVYDVSNPADPQLRSTYDTLGFYPYSHKVKLPVGDAIPELCNSQDDDCDDEIDEGCGA